MPFNSSYQNRSLQTSFEDVLFPPPPVFSFPSSVDEGDPASAPEKPQEDPEPLSVPFFRVQLVRENNSGPFSNRRTIQQPADAARLFQEFLQDKDREYFVALFLDTKNRIIGLNIVSIGTLDSTLVSPREVFKAALLANAAQLILAHNHPSGDPEPSREDRRVTEKLSEAGKLLGIEMLDHIVVGEGDSFCSLKERGAL